MVLAVGANRRCLQGGWLQEKRQICQRLGCSERGHTHRESLRERLFLFMLKEWPVAWDGLEL